MNEFGFQELMCCEGVKTKTIDPDQTLFNLGDVCNHFVFVQTGYVRVELLSTSGKQLLLYRIQNGQSCVMTTACLLGNSNYFAQAVTETPVDLLLIPQSVFDEQLIKSPRFRDFVFDGFSERLASLMERTAQLATQTVDQRLASVLLAQACPEQPHSPINFTHEQLAVEIGTAREVVSRRLAAFEKQRMVEKQRGYIRITNIEKLRAQVED